MDTIIFDERDSLLFAKMDSVAFQATLPMKIAFVAYSEHFIDLCESYIANLETENMEARTFGDEAAARRWVDG